MTIEIPTIENIPQIRNLNQKFLITHLTDTEKQGGFIRIEYTENELKRIIEAKEIVIAKEENKIVGYYLIGRKSDSVVLTYQHNKAINLANEQALLTEKIGYGCQVCIETNYRNNGLFAKMLIDLTKLVKQKYTYLLCSVSDDNVISMNAHRNNGWKIIESAEPTKYLTYNTHQSAI